jgi:hypothetical protein
MYLQNAGVLGLSANSLEMLNIDNSNILDPNVGLTGRLAITGAVTADSASITNAVAAGSAAITNAITAGSANITGTLTAGLISGGEFS